MKITELDADKKQYKKQQQKKEMWREKAQNLSNQSEHDREKFGNIPDRARRRSRGRGRKAFGRWI